MIYLAYFNQFNVYILNVLYQQVLLDAFFKSTNFNLPPPPISLLTRNEFRKCE